MLYNHTWFFKIFRASFSFSYCSFYKLGLLLIHGWNKYCSWLRVSSKFLLSKMKALKFFIWEDLKTGSNTYILRIEPGTNIFNFYFILGQSKNCTYNMKGKAYKYLMRACCLEKLQSILYCASLQISRMWSKYRCASFQLNPLLLLPFSGNSCVGDCINHLWIGLDEPQGTAILQYDLVYMI